MTTLYRTLAAVLLTVCWTAAGQPADATGEPEEFRGMLDAHNALRRPVAAPDLVWSASAARWAQSWADELAAKSKCEARSNRDPSRQNLGENIYQWKATQAYTGYRRLPVDAVNTWGAEAAWYDEESNLCNAPGGKNCSHYTQMVWSRTTAVGCGRARCKSAEIWVCDYLPRGNTHPTSRPYEPSERPPAVRASPEAEVSPARYRDSADTQPQSILPPVLPEPTVH